MKLVAMLAGVVLAAAAVTGCGGGGDGDLTKAEFVEQANAICAKSAASKEAAATAALQSREGSKKKLSGEAFAKALIVDAVLPAFARMSEELAKLGKPDEDADQAADMVSAFESGLQQLEANPGGALKGEDPFAEAKALAQDLGAQRCNRV